MDAAAVREAAAAALERTITAGRRGLLPHQIPPPGDFYGWLLLAGRGAGKTEACSRYVDAHVNGPPCLPGPVPHWIGIIAPTLGDAATACYAGPSGIRSQNPDAKLVQGVGGSEVRWPNGAIAKLFGAHTPEDVERLRAGGNRCLNWLEEIAAWRYLDDCWDQARFGLRSGLHPHWVGSTTPKPRLLIKKLARGEIRRVQITRATTDDNPHLPVEIREELYEAYGSRQIGRQELHGEIIDADENALWRRAWIDDHRVEIGALPELVRRTVGVDPSGGAGEQGIVVFGRENRTPAMGSRVEIHGYILADRTVHLSPDGWGRRAVQTAVEFDADDIVVETNYGGDMAVATIRGAADAMGVSIPVRKVTASRGKRVRAEPVAGLAERGRMHHAGVFEQLEDQMTAWYPEIGWSPDRLDAAVWGAWHTKLVAVTGAGVGSWGGSTLARAPIG